jgi:predicted TIM-barrel fold metal-dependent hydrolase
VCLIDAVTTAVDVHAHLVPPGLPDAARAGGLPGVVAGVAERRGPDHRHRLFYDTVALDPLSLGFLVRRVGAGQVLLGSDAPFPIGDPDPVGTLREAGLADTAKPRILCENANKLAFSAG